MPSLISLERNNTPEEYTHYQIFLLKKDKSRTTVSDNWGGTVQR